MAGISIKATTIKSGARSRGRAATSTRTILRNVSADAHPSQVMSAMSVLLPMLDNIPASYQMHGVRYELLRVERRTVDGVRVRRAVFNDERAVHKSFAREMRRRHRAARKSDMREYRAEARIRRARARALLAMARAAHIGHTAQNVLAARETSPALPTLFLSAPTPRRTGSAASG